MSWNRDLTLDEALADPMIAAVLRADRVDPRQFEAQMRSAARRIAPPHMMPPRAVPLRSEPFPSFAAGDQLQFCRRPAAEGCRAW